MEDIAGKAELLFHLGSFPRYPAGIRSKIWGKADSTNDMVEGHPFKVLGDQTKIFACARQCGFPATFNDTTNTFRATSARLAEFLTGDASKIAVWKNRLVEGQGHAVRLVAIACGFGPSKEWLAYHQQDEDSLRGSGEPDDYWKSFDDPVWTAFAGWNEDGQARGGSLLDFAKALDTALFQVKLACRDPGRYVPSRTRKATGTPAPDELTGPGGRPAAPGSSGLLNQMRQIMALRDPFIEQIQSLPPERSNLVSPDLPDLVRDTFALIEPSDLADEREMISNLGDLQDILFEAFHEVPGNPLAGMLQRGAAQPLNDLLTSLVGRGIARPEDGSSVNPTHDAPIGNFEEALLDRALTECEGLKDSPQIYGRGQRDLEKLRLFLRRARARHPDPADGRKHLDIAKLDARAWPAS